MMLSPAHPTAHSHAVRSSLPAVEPCVCGRTLCNFDTLEASTSCSVDSVAANLVRQAYEAFGAEDTKGLLELLSEDVLFTIPGSAGVVPFVGRHHGKAAVGRFMQLFHTNMQTLDNRPDKILAQDGFVVVFGKGKLQCKATQKVTEGDYCHIWRVANGKVVALKDYIDTVALEASFRKG